MVLGNALDGRPHVRFGIGALTSPRWGVRLFVRELVLILVVTAMLLSHGGTYVLSPERTSMEGTVQAGAAVSDNSDTCTIMVPDGMYAMVSLSDKGFRWHHCQRSSFRAYVNGTQLTLGGSVTVEGNATMEISMTAVADKWCNPYNVAGTVNVAGVQFPHYFPSYHSYTDYYAVQNYSVSVSYYRKLPDLYVSGISFAEDAVSVDENARLSFTVRNGGRLASGRTSVVRVFDGTRQVCEDMSVEALASGASSARSVELPALAVGNHAIRVVVDASGLVEESAEANNEATASLRVYARTEVGVTFDLNGGGKSATVSVMAGEVIAELPSVERSGYDFLGWWTSATDGSEISAKEKITQPRTFYARWKPRTTSITFNRRGGSGGTRTVNATYDAALPAITSPTRPGYDFGGYWTEPGGGGEQVYSADGTGFSPWRADQREATLFAKWTGRTVTFTLERQGGEGGSSSITATYGEALPRVSVPTRRNWAFQGYFAKANGEGIRYYNVDGSGAVFVAEVENMTLYAHWLPVNMECELHLNVQGGTGTTSVKATYGQVFPAVAVPVREGYAFKGYFSEPDGGGMQYSNADGTGATLWDGAVPATLYAKWDRAYRIVLDPNGGSGRRNTHYFTEPAWKLAANTFTRNGYVFAGWALEPDGIPLYPDEAILSKELLGYGDDPDAVPVTLYAAWGKPLSAGLFPGFSFVTGGSGENGGWFAEGGELRSRHDEGVSWVATVSNGRGDLKYACLNEFLDGTVFDFSFYSDGNVYTNSCLNGCEKSVSAMSGAHLAVWSFCKSVEKSCGDVDFGVLPSSVSNEDLLGICNEKRRLAYEDDTCMPQIVDIVITCVRAASTRWYEYQEEACRQAVKEAFDKCTESQTPLYSQVHEELLGGSLNPSYLYSHYISRQNVDVYNSQFVDACNRAEKLLRDAFAIETFIGSCGRISSLTWQNKCFVGIADEDKIDKNEVMALFSEIEKRVWAYRNNEGEVIGRAVKRLWEASPSLSDGQLETARNIVMECLENAITNYVEIYSQFRSRGEYWDGKLVSYIPRRLYWSGYGNLGLNGLYRALDPQNTSYYDYYLRESIDLAQILMEEVEELRQYANAIGLMDYVILDQGGVLGLLPAPEARDGYTFEGWFDENGKAVGENTMVSKDMVVHGKWSLNKYRVLFATNGGTAVEAQIVEHGERVALPAAPTREGYVFEGWYCDSDGNIAVDGNIMAVSAATLYARWTKDAPALRIDKTSTSYFKWGESGGSSTNVNEGGVVYAGRLLTAFANAQVVSGCLYGANGNVVGRVDVKAGKVSKKGKVKISATATLIDGGKAKRVTAKGVSVASTATSAVLTFKAPIGKMAFDMKADGVFTLKNGSYVMAEKSVGGNWSKVGARVYVAATSASLPQGTIENLLPNGEPVIPKGGKWAFAKAASVKYVKDKATNAFGLVIDDTKGSNRSAMKLTYAPKTGVFKGSFKIYAIQDGKLKKFTAKVIGVVVDGKGQGRATGPNGAQFTVTVEP